MAAAESALEAVTIHHDSGAAARVFLFGATVYSFVDDKGNELLFLSKEAVLDGAKAIRGGIPICFPQFAADGPLTKHGLVRTALWELETASGPSAVFTISDSAETRAAWPFPFQLRYTVTIRGPRELQTSLEVRNTGGAIMPFQALLHTYYATPDAAALRIGGLAGTFQDKVQGGARSEHAAGTPLALDREIDRIFDAMPSPATAGPMPGGLSLALQAKSTTAPPNMVVWNAHAAKARAMADMGDEEYKRYVCLEPGRVCEREALEPGQSWTLSQTMRWTAPALA